MPGFDRTGPTGRGPMTGWNRGLCRRETGVGFSGRGLGRGSGRGRGLSGGLGLQRGLGVPQAEEYAAPVVAEPANALETGSDSGTELADLKRQVEQAVQLLHGLTEKIADLETRK